MNASKTLQVLKLFGNDFTSSVFSWLFNISNNLNHLGLRANKLKGPLPDPFTIAVSHSLVFLDLSLNELEGGIPNSFSNLCRLRYLYLSYNKLSDQLQDFVERLSCAADTLTVLDLSYNRFRGPFPDLTRFSSLETIMLPNNSLNGSLPKSLGKLSKVRSLSLAFNQLSGMLPNLAGIASLEKLDLLKNQLNGTLSESLGQLSRLKELDLSSNSFSGVVTEGHFLNLSSLKSLILSHNSLSFNMSSNWIPPFQLKELATTSSKLGPAFPRWLRTQRKLESLDISKASISDSIPYWFWDLSSTLAYMNLSLNRIHGELPNLSSKAYVYPTIDLSSNHLYGSLPPFPPNSTILIFSKNMFSGNMSSLCATRLAPLNHLDLSDNRLSGELPTCWVKFKELFVLNLANNNFSGKIPISLVSLPQIALLHLRNNNFSGELPSFKNLHRELVLLDIGDNRISGRIPEWSGQSLPSLTVLRLRSNELSGGIPTSFCSFPALQVLDLSLNNLSGDLPHCLGNMTAMLSEGRAGGFIDFASVMWRGIELEFRRNLELMRSIDISSNYLSGEIPDNITSLRALHNLNLSRNSLRGSIPVNFGQLNMLESLDLSRNQLSGTILASFSSLNFLSHLDLSHIRLTGRIPLSTQLQSFDASAYEGNHQLCGPPVTKYCPGDPGVTDGHENENMEGDEDVGYVTFGFYVSTAIGFIVGFWGVCGTLVLKSSWRRAYFQFWSHNSQMTKDYFYVTTKVFKARLLRILTSHN
ncbi:receptor-like protein EIX1 [Morus notabilis]|uniref:receptor-like protein EIX1 n=1 Tax=Morus notabilis TaxID=981085 RepID=UPI000CECFCF7|nr:receptor-like protein EIX1 [Morus notabilis]